MIGIYRQIPMFFIKQLMARGVLWWKSLEDWNCPQSLKRQMAYVADEKAGPTGGGGHMGHS